MDIYLLQLLGNWLSVLCVTLTSFFGINVYKEDKQDIENTSYTKTATVVNQVVGYKTEYVYNNKKPSDSAPEVLQEGEYGLIYNYEDGKTSILRNSVNKIVEVGTAKASKYTGRITTYTPYCAGCSKAGNVACYTKDHKKFSLKKNGHFYVDDEYGQVRILAAALTVFPCGTIITVDTGMTAPFNAVVLDTGGTMRKAMRNGYVWMDLAFSEPNKAEAKKISTKNAKFTVQRWGW